MEKVEIISACRALLQSRLDELSEGIAELDLAMESETKSSAGDKHETARARLQTEHENLQRQRREIQVHFQELSEPSVALPRQTVLNGALVQTSIGNFLIGPPVGRLKVGAAELVVVSLRSPLGQQLHGKRAGVCFELNGKEHQIHSIS